MYVQNWRKYIKDCIFFYTCVSGNTIRFYRLVQKQKVTDWLDPITRLEWETQGGE